MMQSGMSKELLDLRQRGLAITGRVYRDRNGAFILIRGRSGIEDAKSAGYDQATNPTSLLKKAKQFGVTHLWYLDDAIASIDDVISEYL